MSDSGVRTEARALRGDGTLCNGGDAWIRFLCRTGAEGDDAFVARNFLLDEGVVPERSVSYGELGCMVDHGTVEDWRGAHEGYLQDRVFRLPPGDGLPSRIDPADEISCPETFRFFDPGSRFLSSDLRLCLVRVEKLDFVAHYGNLAPDKLDALARAVLDSHDGTAVRDLNSVLAAWAQSIDVRPVFAAFFDDLLEIFNAPAEDSPDWANDLRDCLGLAHYDPVDRLRGSNRPLKVLVFKYPVADVPAFVGRQEARLLLPPTVLDARFSPAFLPAPRGGLTGHVVDLSGRAANVRREVVHPSVPFQAKHLFRIGAITRPVDLDLLPTARGVHLLMVRDVTGRQDYAQGTDGEFFE